MPSNDILNSPYGGKLVDLLISADERDELFSYATSLQSLQLSPRQTFDLEMLACGGFSPLDRFMTEADYRSVVENMRLADGTLYPIPVTLAVDDVVGFKMGSDVALRDSHNDLLALLTIEEIYETRADLDSESILGTADPKHPFRLELARSGRFNLSGPIRMISLPFHVDNRDIRLTPQDTRDIASRLGRRNVVAFQTRNPIHAAHESMMREAMEAIDGTLLLHPVVGLTKDGDIDHFTRVRVYRAVIEQAFPKDRAFLALLPLAMRMAGPREALFHAIIRRNYGASHFIVGRDHASPGIGSNGEPYYRPSAARELAKSYEKELGIEIMPFDEFVYVPSLRAYFEVTKVPQGESTTSLSGTEIRRDYIERGTPLPSWFTRPEVAEIIAENHPPRHRQGFCVWFTGLSGSGKSTTAELLSQMLLEFGRQSTVLDGDVVRTHLSKGLGFSKEDRDTNILRIGFVASEISRHGGVAICAAVSPYRQARNEVRAMFPADRFIEVFVDTPLKICEGRDTKGMYAKARRGEIKNFTGIDDIYEPPTAAEITLKTESTTALENAGSIFEFIKDLGFIDRKHFRNN